MPCLRLAAPAKINLHLEVLGRDAAGFHLLETIFQTLELADSVSVETAPGAAVTLCTCDLPGLECGPGNLAVRAVEALRPHLPGLGTVRIHLEKRIPVGGGLGGGSSDAAAVLRALDALVGPLPAATLRGVAASLGSDVPFFLLGGTAHGLGRGGDLTPLPALPSQAVTLLMPPFGCPTPQVFAALTEAERGPRRALGPAVWADRLVRDLPGALVNRLMAPAARLFPELSRIFTELERLGRPWLMSGSGSTCFVLGTVEPPPGVRAVTTRFAVG